MEIGVCAAAKIDDIDYAVLAEELGYSHFWVADSQMISSDCYATLALVAARTTRMQIGTGVAVAGTRPAAVQAAAMATINRLAPGRTFCGVGTGNTAMRIMGHKPIPLAEFDDYLVTMRTLMDGGEATVRWRGATAPTRHLMPDAGFVAFSPRIPLYVSAFGPKAMAVAARRGDGVVLGIPPDPAAVTGVYRRLAETNPAITPETFHSCLLTTMVVLQPGESAASRRVFDEAGAMAAAALHYAYEQQRQYGRPPAPAYADFWPDYVASVEETPEERRHLRIHAGHNCWVEPEDEPFVTPALLERTCMIGTPEQLAAKLRALEAAGLRQVMILPSLAAKEKVLRDVAEQVFPLV
jgi:alkanesulfonate monooxygenase SsuD/methylene tetrahydromethanopterin reductase-like flavin-dependent oxidoreductase (luciferase family)